MVKCVKLRVVKLTTESTTLNHYKINAYYPKTPMMGVPILRKIEICGHRTCVGLLITKPGPELTLFLSSNTNFPVVRLSLSDSGELNL